MPTVPLTRTAVAGEVVLASHFNSHIRDVLNYLLAVPIFKGRQTVTQSIPNNAHTALLIDAEDEDSVGGHSTVSATSRYVLQYPGWYQPSGAYSFTANATGARGSYFAKNGTPINASNTLGPTVSGSAYQAPTRTDMVFGNIGDYVELFVYQNSGAALLTAVTAQEQASFIMRWIRN